MFNKLVFFESSKFSFQPSNNVEGSQKVSASANQECRTSQPTSHGLGPTFLGQHAVNMEVLSPAVRAQAVLAIGKMCLQVGTIFVIEKCLLFVIIIDVFLCYILIEF